MKISVQDIALSGAFASLAIVIGIFAQFRIGQTGIYLVGIIPFISIIFIRLPLAIITTAIALIISDARGGYLASSWITIVAYIPALFVVWFFSRFKFKLFYTAGLLLAGVYIINIYYVLEGIMYDFSYSAKNVIPNIIQVGIVIGITMLLYYPSLILKRSLFYESTRTNK